MAKKTAVAVETVPETVPEAPPPRPANSVCVQRAGQLTFEPIDLAPGEVFFPKWREVHINGEACIHVADAPDGEWIYAPRYVSHR